MKSASSQRPHRMVGAEPHRLVDRLDRAHAFLERVDRLVDHRQQDAVDDERREVLRHGGRLAEASTKPGPARKSSPRSAMPRMSSTSCITGTGFMKWMPMNCSGRSVEAARRVIEIDDVLDATIASFFSTGQSALNILRLTLSSSVAASITRSHLARSGNPDA